MKNSSISDKVFEVNLNYVKLQNQTKELFFKCLEEGQDIDYFKAKLEKLWGSLDYSYLDKQIAEYQDEIHEKNVHENVRKEKGITKGIFKLVPIAVILGVDKKFQNVKVREYTTSINSPAYKTDKEEYLKLKVKRYNNQIVPYELHKYDIRYVFDEKTRLFIGEKYKTDEVIGYRYVQPSTYDSMIQNTNLTRSGWNQTLSDGDEVGQGYYYIPNHSFSCPDCIEHQEKPMTKYEVERLVGEAEETEGELLHPNCKCELTFFTERTKLKRINNLGELEEQYHIRQKVNTLTLRKEEVLTDMKIQNMLGNQDEVDKLNQQRNRINKEIRELKEALPTTELQKQVVVISR